MKIAITGIDNTHTAGFAQAINNDKLFEGFCIEYVCDTNLEAAKEFAEKFAVANICEDVSEALGEVDAAIVAHRLGSFHFDAAMPFIEQSKPVFIDKPLTISSEQGAELLGYARKKGVAVSSFSVVPYQRTFNAFMQQICGKTIDSGAVFGHCDTTSPYGGVYFYGIHQVEMALKAFGYDVADVEVGEDSATLLYADGKRVKMSLVPAEGESFKIEAVCDGDVLKKVIEFDENYLLAGINMAIEMFKTGIEPRKHSEILKSIEILERIAAEK